MCLCTPVFIDKSAKSKKRDGGTPDKMSSPVGSAVHIPDELCIGPSVGKVITGDDIDSLAINVDELKKVSVHTVKTFICNIHEICEGGAVASWLVYSTPESVLWL